MVNQESRVTNRFIGSKGEAESELKTPYWALSYNFPYNPDPLCSGNNYAIYDEMIDDDQVKSAIAIKKDMVVNTGWKICGDNQEINDFVTDCFKNINEGIGLDTGFDDTLRDMLSAYEYGFSLAEPIYIIENGKYIYKGLRTRPPHSFLFNIDDKGNIISVTQNTIHGANELKPSIFIHHVYQPQFGNPYGKSDLRAAYVAWKAKKFFIRMYAVAIEKFAAGTIVVKYPKNYTGAEIEELHTIVKSIQNATTLAIPEDTLLEFIQVEKNEGGPFIKGLDYYNMQIARSILVPDLMGLGGTETKGGSYALGKEQFKTFLGTIKKDRESLGRKITMKLVRPLVLANFGDNDDCWFEFLPYTHEDVLEYLKVWVEAIRAGAYAPNEEEINYFRSVIGFPEGQVKEKPAPILPPQFLPKDKLPPKPEEPEIEVEEESYARFHRELTTYEKKVDFNTIQETLDREEIRIISALKRDASNIYNDLIEQIRDKGLLRKFKPEKIRDLEPKNLRPMNVTLKNFYIDLFKESLIEAKKEIFPQGDVKKYAIELLPDQFLDLLKIEAFKSVGDYSVDITKRAKNMLIQSVKDAVGEAEALKIIRDGLKDSSETWIETVARTKTTEIYNEARKKYWETDELAKQIVEAYQWSSILDDRTSDICRHLDGKIFTIGELSNRVKPPAHFRCRSLLVPITKFEDYEESPESDFEEDKLREMGGGLLKPN